ncbi:MAG: hypothetical protein U1E97_13390, partial [Alphaproteobacteria bacterium]
GDDAISGGDGNDKISGGAGGDYIYGGKGNDTMSGGAGTDIFLYEQADGAGNDVITDWDSGDVIWLCGQPEFTPVKVQFIAADFVSDQVNGDTNDVYVLFNNGQKLTILNAASDFTQGLDFTPVFATNTVAGSNADDFVHVGFNCPPITCTVPPVPAVPAPFDFWGSL